MSGKTTALSGLAALETRKRILVLESDLNRKLLLSEWTGVQQEFQGLTGRLGSLGSLAAMAAQVGAASTGFFGGFSPPPTGADQTKSSWFSTVLRGFRIGGQLWSVLRSRR